MNIDPKLHEALLKADAIEVLIGPSGYDISVKFREAQWDTTQRNLESNRISKLILSAGVSPTPQQIKSYMSPSASKAYSLELDVNTIQRALGGNIHSEPEFKTVITATATNREFAEIISAIGSLLP